MKESYQETRDKTSLSLAPLITGAPPSPAHDCPASNERCQPLCQVILSIEIFSTVAGQNSLFNEDKT